MAKEITKADLCRPRNEAFSLVFGWCLILHKCWYKKKKLLRTFARLIISWRWNHNRIHHHNTSKNSSTVEHFFHIRIRKYKFCLFWINLILNKRIWNQMSYSHISMKVYAWLYISTNHNCDLNSMMGIKVNKMIW